MQQIHSTFNSRLIARAAGKWKKQVIKHNSVLSARLIERDWLLQGFLIPYQEYIYDYHLCFHSCKLVQSQLIHFNVCFFDSPLLPYGILMHFFRTVPLSRLIWGSKKILFGAHPNTVCCWWIFVIPSEGLVESQNWQRLSRWANLHNLKNMEECTTP